MKSKTKTEIKAYIKKLESLGDKEVLPISKRLDRLFGEVRREFAEIKQSAERVNDELLRSREYARDKEGELSKIKLGLSGSQRQCRELSTRLETLESQHEKLFHVADATWNHVVNEYVEAEQFCFIPTATIAYWINLSRENNLLAMMATLPAILDVFDPRRITRIRHR